MAAVGLVWAWLQEIVVGVVGVNLVWSMVGVEILDFSLGILPGNFGALIFETKLFKIISDQDQLATKVILDQPRQFYWDHFTTIVHFEYAQTRPTGTKPLSQISNY